MTGATLAAGDPTAILQVLVNLTQNAVDASSRGQTVWIRSGMVDGDVVFEVLDEGPGVPAAVQQQIFEPFFTTKGPKDGTGLGLYLARELALRCRGDLGLLPVGERRTFSTLSVALDGRMNTESFPMIHEWGSRATEPVPANSICFGGVHPVSALFLSVALSIETSGSPERCRGVAGLSCPGCGRKRGFLCCDWGRDQWQGQSAFRRLWCYLGWGMEAAKAKDLSSAEVLLMEVVDLGA